VYEPPRFMSVATAIEQLLEVEERRREGAYGRDTLCIGVARLGSDSQQIVAGSMQQLVDVDFGQPLHSLVIAGDTHPIEREYLQQFMVGSGAAAAGGGEAAPAAAAADSNA
jgi:diphthine synthase